MKILNLYHSTTGNTDKVAERIDAAVRDCGFEVETVRAGKDEVPHDIGSYDLVFVGSGVYGWLPGKKLIDTIGSLAKGCMSEFGGRSEIVPGAPRRPGRHAAVYCTFGGSHTGVNEAVPAVKYMGQLFDHLGYEVAAEWYVVGAYRTEKLQHHNIHGRMGDIRDRPNKADLQDVYQKTCAFIRSFLRIIHEDVVGADHA